MSDPSHSEIHIMYWMGYGPGNPDSPEFKAWNEQIRQAVAEIGWRLKYHYDPMSSTNQDGYYLGIESDGGPLERETLERVMKGVGIENGGYCTGDILDTKPQK